jgi:hypothetical protein
MAKICLEKKKILLIMGQLYIEDTRHFRGYENFWLN